MLENVELAESLRAHALRAAQSNTFESIKPQLIDEYVANGWTVQRRNKGSVRVSRQKPLSASFEDRVWTLLYRMGFPILSGKGGALLRRAPQKDKITEQLDVVAADDDVGLYVECKSSQNVRKTSQFAELSGQLKSYRSDFLNSLKELWPTEARRKAVPIIWLWNIQSSENDQARAEADGVRVMDRGDLEYYEQLVKQIGPAAKYQFLADLLENTEVSGLGIVVPAIRTRMGRSRCYVFAIKPSKLLKIAYVSHRSKGKATDINTYQRLIKKSRLQDIRRFISAGGIFPTNIVLSLSHRRRLRFDAAEAPRGHKDMIVDGEYGWLYLPSVYKSAWVIDGQHRLFAYAGHELADKSELTVLAFDDLSPSQQANMFVDINAEQKSVKRNLLVELWAELHWDSLDPMEQAKAVRSKVVQALDEDPESALFNRVQRADDVADLQRCITIQTLTSALKHPEFFISTPKGVSTPGAFWTNDLTKTLRRGQTVLSSWFNLIRAEASSLWDLGKAPGGAIAMNNGITIQLNVLRSVLRYIAEDAEPLHQLTTDELVRRITPFAQILGRHFYNMSSSEALVFRKLQGVAGTTTGTRECQAAIAKVVNDFRPIGLDDYMLLRDSKTSEEAQNRIFHIQRSLHKYLMDDLKAEYGADEQGWWSKGIPKEMRVRIDAARNQEETLEPRESKFFLIEYRDIIMYNWDRLGPVFGNSAKKNASKKDQTFWLVRINDIRNIAAHPEKGFVSLEDLEYTRAAEQWFFNRIEGLDEDRSTIESLLPSSDQEADEA